MMATPLPSRWAITPATRKAEKACIDELLQQWQAPSASAQALINARARSLVTAIRQANPNASGVDLLMQEFSLSSSEGVALMCLAESLLRIPDTATMDKLIRDKIGKGNWQAHLGQSRSLFVNAAAWGLMISGKLVNTYSEQNLSQALSKLIATGGEPLIRKSVEFTMWLLGKQFVMGETIDSALHACQKNLAQGYTHSFDMLGEAALTMEDAQVYCSAYESAIHAIGQSAHRPNSATKSEKNPPSPALACRHGISVKLSALHPRYTLLQKPRVLAELYPSLLKLCTLAKLYDIGLNIDAEEADRLELSLDLIDRLAFEATLQNWQGLGVVVQAYQKRAPMVLHHLAQLTQASQRPMMVRLVKGAYWDSEIKRAQTDGLADYPVFTRKHHTDVSYLVCAKILLGYAPWLYPQFATHNAYSFAVVEWLATTMGVTHYEFQCLHGMGEPLYDQVVGRGIRCRIYAPVGRHQALLPYLVRRLLENGANSSFVNRIVNPQVSIETLIADPFERTQAEGGSPHPAIVLPPNLYGKRKNARACDLHCAEVVEAWQASLMRLAKAPERIAVPIVAGGLAINIAHPQGREVVDIRNPAKRSERIGRAVWANHEDVAQALMVAEQACLQWGQTPAPERAQRLYRAADLLEEEREEVIYLCLYEAGKSWANAQAEWREAVDFLRYYAQSAENLPSMTSTPSEITLCLSPWNFPLAIFLGQISAALASGHPVIAKCAEQTPLIAMLAINLLHHAGVPQSALQFLPGRGETVGTQLVRDRRVKNILFTGSTEVAKIIEQNLIEHNGARGEVKFIAETGGQNVMVVDSSALPEQVVQDVLTSAFDGAGQRCSALRVLCLQEDIADKVCTMLRQAMTTWVVGDPRYPHTDIGAVIDENAQEGLIAYIETKRRQGHRVESVTLSAECAHGVFVPPTLIYINRLDELSHEVFGPVLHILCYRANEQEPLIQAINGLGYGLTFGIHSRIDEHIDKLSQAITVGNVYINRHMVGAVVGVQPFGGCRLSGTGPKAGGPWYVPYLAGVIHPDLHALGGRRVNPPATKNAQNHPQRLAFADLAQQAFADLALWALHQGHRLLSHAIAEYASHSPLAFECALPSPTGERNTLSYHPRGRVLGIAFSQEGIWHQIAAILACGNTPVFIDSDEVQTALATLPATVQKEVQRLQGINDLTAAIAPSAIDWTTISAVLWEAPKNTSEPFNTAQNKTENCAIPNHEARCVQWAQTIAQATQTLVPIIRAKPIGKDCANPLAMINPDGEDPPYSLYPLYRLVFEKCRSINTTAAGGNASLMTMED